MAHKEWFSDLREAVIRPTLKHLELWSPAAENLLVGTIAIESGGRRLRQAGGGPARGLYQIEPATHDDVWENYLEHKPKLSGRVALLMTSWFAAGKGDADHRELDGNLFYSTAIVRIIYLRVPEVLPHADDIAALAVYWKKYYNTPLGKGDPAEFLARYPG
jgi:hypothetical protein